MSVKYTREEIREKVTVSPRVLEELQGIVEDHLKKCGIFYRLFSRVKTPASLEHKYQIKNYGGDEKIQDLVGMRINLYFQDDIRHCKRLLEQCFHLNHWSESGEDISTFEQTKINGVFVLPDYLVDEISKDAWEMAIDKTFEVQIKTIFFEGWHEVEHDMRYKNKEIWADHPDSARRLNSILATLELCDDSIVSTFEDLAHDLYKANDFENMIRMHFRLKMKEMPLYEGLQEILMADGKTLAKKVFKFSRGKLVKMLFKQKTPIPINVNTILALVNEEALDSPEITAIMKEKHVFQDGKERGDKQKNKRPAFATLTPKMIFGCKVRLRVSEQEKTDRDTMFGEVSAITYDWLYQKYQSVFEAMPEHIWPGDYKTDGYEVSVEYMPENLCYEMYSSHVAPKTPGRIYKTQVRLYAAEEETDLVLEIKNYYKDMQKFNSQMFDFSYPSFYRQIYERAQWSVVDVEPLSREVDHVTGTEQAIQKKKLINDKGRCYPVVCIVRPEEDGPSDDWIRMLSRFSWMYAHVFSCDQKEELELFGGMTVADRTGGIYVVPARKEARDAIYHSWSEAENCKYNWRLGYDREELVHNILTGDAAFHHQMINEIRQILLRDCFY